MYSPEKGGKFKVFMAKTMQELLFEVRDSKPCQWLKLPL